jgi:hypothetical protein
MARDCESASNSPSPREQAHHRLATTVCGTKKTHRDLVEFEFEGETCHLAVRPPRLRDGTPHPCAMVLTMRCSVTGTSAFQMSRAQVLGDYLLLWLAGLGQRDRGLGKLYSIAWKQGSIKLVSFHRLSYIGHRNTVT